MAAWEACCWAWSGRPTKLHGVATDRYENFAIATGPLDGEVEAVYFLDFLTGDLKAAVLNINNGKFNAFFSYNILQDLGVDAAKNPRYLMVTGVADLRRIGGSNVQPSASVVYVAELTTGRIAAYAVPWNPTLHKQGAAFQGSACSARCHPIPQRRRSRPMSTGRGSNLMTLPIVVNGQPRSVAAETSVASLLAELGVRPQHCAVEINLELVPRGQHAERMLEPGDRLEIVTLVGGG